MVRFHVGFVEANDNRAADIRWCSHISGKLFIREGKVRILVATSISTQYFQGTGAQMSSCA
uniref:Uncharacterized protein n=1 Tax=Arundo donax TaxID=35708 RepID=A0A0A9GRF4_ARUDO